LSLILFNRFLHLFHALLSLTHLLLQAVNLRLVSLSHSGSGLILLSPALQVQVLSSYVFDDVVFVDLLADQSLHVTLQHHYLVLLVSNLLHLAQYLLLELVILLNSELDGLALLL
jgi:hypothetical protein